MLSLTLVAVAIATTAYIVHWYNCFRKNLDAAKRSGLPYVCSPVYTFNRFWIVTHRLFLVLLRRLPVSWTDPWIAFLSPEWVWTYRYKMFRKLDSDIFIIVTAGQNTVFVADAEAVSQICTRRMDFPKPIKFYGALDLYGKNVVSTESSIWRHHRKITSVPFNEKNNALVFAESLRQAQAMLASWGRLPSGGTQTLRDLAADTMRVSLHVISRAGFGVRIQWPHEDAKSDTSIPEGHTMTYQDALTGLLDHIILVLLMPKCLMVHSPFELPRRAHESFIEWGKYMAELAQAKKAEIRSGESYAGMDLMGALVRGAGIRAESDDSESGKRPSASTSSNKPMLTDEEILGNVFVFILAGHETAANTLHFSLIYLALRQSSQQRLQADLDQIFGNRQHSEWNYDKDVPRLFSSMCGAVMNETLRLVPPVLNIPKSTAKGSPQPLTTNTGRRVVVPEDSFVPLCAVAVHRNPKYWPTCDIDRSDIDAVTKDLDSFKPERWLKNFPGVQAPPMANGVSSAADKNEDVGGPLEPDMSAALYTPPRGAYIPFSEGARACLGRRFAQVEVLAVLAAIFREYSVELAVDEYASDAEVEGMTREDKTAVWDKARQQALWHLEHSMASVITHQMRGAHVPLRFVKRGEERFVNR